MTADADFTTADCIKYPRWSKTFAKSTPAGVKTNRFTPARVKHLQIYPR